MVERRTIDIVEYCLFKSREYFCPEGLADTIKKVFVAVSPLALFLRDYSLLFLIFQAVSRFPQSTFSSF